MDKKYHCKYCGAEIDKPYDSRFASCGESDCEKQALDDERDCYENDRLAAIQRVDDEYGY